MLRGASQERHSVIFIFLVALFLLWCAFDSANARSLIIYYANETVPEALESRNYRALLAVLDGMQNEVGSAAANGLRSDAQTFRTKVLQDISSLQNAARSNAFDLAVFTNTLALQGKYLAVRLGTEELGLFNVPRGPYDPVMEYSPLAVRVNFGLAIVEALRKYTHKDEIILIVNSHGTKEFAIIPRIAADFTRVDIENLRQQLESQQGNDLALQSVELGGIKKIDLWKELDRATRASHMHLSLVFLQACESAASSWKEYFAIPSTVDKVAHTGFTSISPEQFDYTLLSGSEQADYDQVGLVTDLLRQTGAVYFDSKYSYWRWPLLVTAASLPKLIYFAPLGLWLFASLLKMRRRFYPAV